MILFRMMAGFMLMLMAPVLQASSLSLTQILQANFANNPALDSVRLQVEMRQLDVDQADAMLDTTIMGSAGMSDAISPTVSPFAASGTQVSFISGQVVKPLLDGSSLTASINYNRSELSYPSSVPANFQANINPIYQHQIDVIYRYPLWKGAGNTTYQASKDAANYAVQAVQMQQHVLKEQLASQGTALYFQAMLNDLALSLSKDAVMRATQLLTYQRQREQFGLIEKADRLQASALLAMRELQRVQAQGAKNVTLTGLNRFMYQAEDMTIEPVLKRIDVKMQSVEQALHEAKGKRPIFSVLDAQYAAAQAALRQAEDSNEQQLDLVAQLGTRALDGSADVALGQGFTLDDRYVGLKIEFSDTLNHRAGRVGIQKSLLSMANINIERRKSETSIQTELANIDAMLKRSRATLQATKAQVQAEQAKFKAEMLRYREGRSNTATIIQFEGELRAAELRWAMEQMTLHQASYQWALAKGELLSLLGLDGDK